MGSSHADAAEGRWVYALMRDTIITSDLHLTTHERDAYRWEFLDWLYEKARRLRVDTIWILGDLTDAKDFHSSLLVNKVVEKLARFRHADIEEEEIEIKIVKGNHDGVDPDMPYFLFLNQMGIDFISAPTYRLVDRVLILPHTRTPQADWANVKRLVAAEHSRYAGKCEYILMHATVAGAVSESGYVLSGIPIKAIPNPWHARIISGDIHSPQQIAGVNYVGAPYHVHFGDWFIPQVLYFDHAGIEQNLHPPYIRRFMLDVKHPDELKQMKVRDGDQAKIRIHLPRSEFGSWHKYKQRALEIADSKKLHVAAIELVKVEDENRQLRHSTAKLKESKEQTFERYCKAAKVAPKLTETGLKLIRSWESG